MPTAYKPSVAPTQRPLAQPIQQPQPVQPQSDAVTQLKARGYDDKDIEFLKQAKQKGYTSQQAFSYLDNKKKSTQN